MQVSRGIDWDELVAELPALVTIDEYARFRRCSKTTAKTEITKGFFKTIRGVHGGSSRVLIPRAEVIRHLRHLAGEG